MNKSKFRNLKCKAIVSKIKIKTLNFFFIELKICGLDF